MMGAASSEMIRALADCTLKPGPTIQQLAHEYLRDRRIYFTNYDGSSTSRPDRIETALKHLRRQYGDLAAEKFGPLLLQEFQQSCVAANLARSTINAYCWEVKAFFRWYVYKEKINIAVYQALATVPSLQRGRSQARETMPISPVPLSSIWRLREYLPKHWYTLCWLHIYTAARPGELIGRKLKEIEMGKHVWTVHLDKHKNKWRGQERVIVMGPASQALLKPLIEGIDPEDYIFSINGRNRPYTIDAWRKAIHRACDGAGISRWQPNQLRHTAATMIRERFGVEAAQVFLGHSSITTTQIYAETNRETAHKIAKEIG